LLAFDMAAAVWVGWIAAWFSRQIGHFFFEPKDYDVRNAMSYQEKEDVKVGYNLKRKVMLLSAFLAAPALPYLAPGLFGLIRPYTQVGSFLGDLTRLWLAA